MAEAGCAGILVADTFCGPMKELPREGRLVAVDSMPSRAGGCAANVAIDLAKQGVVCDVIGCVGQDPSAAVIVRELEAAHVGCDRIAYVPDYATSRTVILLVEGQDRRYIHMFGANAAFTAAHIPRDWLAGLKVFYLGGLFLMPSFRTEEFLELLKFCRAHGVTSVVDVVVPQRICEFRGHHENDVPEICRNSLAPLLPFVDYFLPNEDEARTLTGCAEPLDQVGALVEGGAGTVVVTCGKNGAVGGRNAQRWRVGGFGIEAVDPSGSGDAFSSGIVTGILRGWELPQTLVYASALGASAARAVGTTAGVFTAAAAEAFLATHTLQIDSAR